MCMSRVWRVSLAAMVLACGACESHDEMGSADPASRLERLEGRLLAADTVRLSYRVRAQGAVEAELAGEVSLVEERIEVTGSGHFAGQPVEVFLHAGQQSYEFGNRVTRTSLPTPDSLREALVIGFTRMGILHNLARLSAAAPPDHADGGVREWASVDSVITDPADPAAVSFGLIVAGKPSGTASLEISEAGLPVLRRQTVEFPSGAMRVEERYSMVTIHP